MIDLRSDTVTRPTAAMYAAMKAAALGDDVYGDDPTVNELEALAARVMGKEAALFVCSGTMGNQLAIMSHTRPGEEMIAGRHSHVIEHEAGGHARLSGVSAMLVETGEGWITGEEVVRNLRSTDIHHPKSSLLCLENALGNGLPVTAAATREAAEAAHANGLMVHLDGARIFNAATALGVDVQELAAPVDSVMFCLSKGLCAPVGSMLCGSRDFVARARRNRKILGGGLRQAGVLAACGLVSLREMTGRLEEDHENARLLAEALAGIPGVLVDLTRVRTNMVWARLPLGAEQEAAFVSCLGEAGLLINGATAGQYRFVTHHDVNREDVHKASALILEALQAVS